jgi:hypothetical protein
LKELVAIEDTIVVPAVVTDDVLLNWLLPIFRVEVVDIDPVTVKLPVIRAEPVNGKDAPAVALIVTEPVPLVGLMVTFVPATI